jgi:sphingolipid delta-4 desaturase
VSVQVKELFGVDDNLKYKVLAYVGIQLVGAYLATLTPSWGAWFLLTYIMGGTFNHSLTLAMHELSHNLAFKGAMLNRMLGFVANLPLGIPSFMYVRSGDAGHWVHGCMGAWVRTPCAPHAHY